MEFSLSNQILVLEASIWRRDIRPVRTKIEYRNLDCWQTDLAMKDNKMELASFLSAQVSMVKLKENYKLVASSGFTEPKPVTISIILHAHHTFSYGYNRVVVARDTDVLLLSV